MKKMTKQTLDELAETLIVMEKSEQIIYNGKYYNDCFWRCVNRANGGDINDENAAEYYANSYYEPAYGYNTQSLLNYYGSGTTAGEIREYVNSSSTLHGKIAIFDPNSIPFYFESSSTGLGHACFVKFHNPENKWMVLVNPETGAELYINSIYYNKIEVL